MNRLMHAQPYWSRPGTVPDLAPRAAAKWLKECDRNGWTPLFEEAFKGRVNNVLGLLRLAKSAYGDAGLWEYVRIRDDLRRDARDWARMHVHKNWQVIDLLTRYGGYTDRCL